MSSAKSRKKRKPLHEFGVNNLDNTAPIKCILDEVQHKNPNAYKFYCQVLGKTPSVIAGAHCAVVGHNLATFPSDWDGELPHGYHEDFTYKSNLPRVITSARNTNERDPVAEYMIIKKKWSTQAQHMYNLACKKIELTDSYKRLSEEVVRCPQYFVEMAAHAQRDPDPRFSSHYNWYYAGRGNLHHLTTQQHSYLLHSQLTCLYLSSLNGDGPTANFDESFTFDCGENNLILETITSPQNSLIALRTMNKIFLLKFEENEEPCIRVLTTLESKVAYTSMEFDPHHEVILYVTSLDDTVDIVNLKTLQSLTVVLNKDPDYLNNWNTVQGFDRLHYIHTTKKAIHMFDKRTHAKAYSINNHKLVCAECNNISVIRKSERLPNCFYFGTNHHLFCVDVRSNSNLKPTILTRWTHGMQCPPTYASVDDYEVGKELISLSSQWPEDTTVIVNDTAHLEAGLPPDFAVMPYKPKTIFDSISEARMKRLCLDPTLHIERRLSTAITGFLVLENNEKYDLYLQNSLGDITQQTLYPDHLESCVEKDFSEELDSWAKSLKVLPEKLQVTEVLDLSGFWEYCRTPRTEELKKPKRRESTVNFSENAIVDLIGSEGFDDGLLTAWNMEGE